MHAERTTRSDTLELRAAKYFGVHTEPRTTIRLGRYSCLVVLERAPDLTVFAVYNDVTRPAGCSFVSLTAKQVEAVREALFFGGELDDA